MKKTPIISFRDDQLIFSDTILETKPKNDSWKRVRESHPVLFNEISACLFNHDPLDINYITNTDEYDPEAGSIIPELEKCGNFNDVQKLVYEVFCQWFSEDHIGSFDSFEEVSQAVWKTWKKNGK